MAEEAIAFNKQELRSLLSAFKAMDEEAVKQAKSVSNGLATYLQSKIIKTIIQPFFKRNRLGK